MITPGTSQGSITLVINKVPGGSDPLSVVVNVQAAANIGSVQFDSVVTPDQPKP